jgi:nucleoside-diphosphate-sugar epimerase
MADPHHSRLTILLNGVPEESLMRALVIGGTGPTGHHIVNGLIARGYRVEILHRGNHEVEEIPPEVLHHHMDPYDPALLEAFFAAAPRFDLCVATYGRLRAIASATAGRIGRLISAGGVPAYRGYMNPALGEPAGLPVPTGEDAPRVAAPAEDEKGWRIVQTEDALFAAHPDATHLRYPYVYGKYQPMPREWPILRRILDGRAFIILPDGGLTLHHMGYAENVARGILLAADHPASSRGRVYNCADEEVLSLRQSVEIIAAAMGRQIEIVSMPWELAPCTRPLVMQPLTTHRVLDISRIRAELGYRDAVPAREALARTARWLAEHPPAAGGIEEMVLEDPFDYAAEDRLRGAWEAAIGGMPRIGFDPQPGYTMSYSGPGGRDRSNSSFTG